MNFMEASKAGHALADYLLATPTDGDGCYSLEPLRQHMLVELEYQEAIVELALRDCTNRYFTQPTPTKNDGRFRLNTAGRLDLAEYQAALS